MTEASALSAQEYYAVLVAANRGIVSAAQQQALRDATVLVAGCGSVGGAAVQSLARLGARRFVLAEPGRYGLGNLNRQQATARDIGRNKAEVAAEWIAAVNPHAEVKVRIEGVTPANAAELTHGCQLVVDGVDVTTRSGQRAKFALHSATAGQLPLVTAWDLAGAVCAQHFDYRRITRPFGGALCAGDLDGLTSWELIARVLPLRRVPADMLAEVNANIATPGYRVPQVSYTASLAGAVLAHMAVRILAGEVIRENILIDIHQAARSAPARLSALLSWPREAVRLRRLLAR